MEPDDFLPLRDEADLDPLLECIGDARYVLVGEASHGTAEFYAWRAALTRRLIAERGFSLVAVEGDWPDCFAVNRSVKLAPGAGSPREVLAGFERWPTWMWANTEVAAFAEWLRARNAELAPAARVGFYGLDVYSLWDSLRAIIDYLRERAPEHVDTAMQAWRCFEPYGEDPHEYAWATRLVPESCEEEVVDLLGDLVGAAHDGVRDDGPEAALSAEQNAAVAAGAERYYRAMVRGGAESWNVRDRHMADTLARLVAHHGPGAKAVVWEHNSHIGDARATDMAAAEMVNVGQLVRERHAEEGVVLVGFGSDRGTVIAADGWGAPLRRLPVPPARGDSVEALLRDAGCLRGLYLLRPGRRAEWLAGSLPHRAIGVVYHPERERSGNYVPTVLGDRYDAFLFLSETEALTPLGAEPDQRSGERETFPHGR